MPSGAEVSRSHLVVIFLTKAGGNLKFLIRLRMAIYCLFYGYAAVPLSSYNTMCISEDSILLTNGNKEKSVDIALWALERPEHYWRATALGQEVYAQALKSTERTNVEA